MRNSGVNQYYFFLPNIGNGFTTEIAITNHSQNSISPEKFDRLLIAIHSFDQKRNIWVLLDKLKFDSEGVTIISSKKYTKKEGDLAVASFHDENQKLNHVSSSLPMSSIKKNDFSPHTVRCRLSFRKQGCFSSYMSEYPKKMTFMKSGSSFSYGHLLSNQNSLSSTVVAFINISDIKIESLNQTMKLIDIDAGKIIFSEKILPNKANIHFIKNNKIKGKSLAFVTQGLSGIPIFISEYKNKFGEMRLSCEHSLAPSEYFYENALPNQKNLKANWFKKLL